MKRVFIVNGHPRSGKDTFAKLLNEFIDVYKTSIIDGVKSMALDCGWNGGKTERDRKFLSDLKQLTDDYSEYSFNFIFDKVHDFWKNKIEEEILLIDMREPADIARAVLLFNAETIFIVNDNIEKVDSNVADANVENFTYDFYIENNGDLNEFRKNVENFAMYLITRGY